MQKWQVRNQRARLAISKVPLRFFCFEQPKIIYCPIAKNSSTFFKALLFRQNDPDVDFEGEYQNIHQYARVRRDLRVWDLSKMTDSSYLKFVILRDPLERVVSAYLNKFVSCRKNTKVADTATRSYMELIDSEIESERLLNFRQFVRLICTQADSEMDQHWRPQTSFLREQVDHFQWLVPQSRLAEFFPVLEQRLGTEITRTRTKNKISYTPVQVDEDITRWRPRKLRNQGLYPDKDQLLNDRLRAALEKRYADDLALCELAQHRFTEQLDAWGQGAGQVQD